MDEKTHLKTVPRRSLFRERKVRSGFVLCAAAGIAGLGFNTPRPGKATEPLATARAQSSDDAIARYEVAKDTGAAAEACMDAGLIAGAFILAKDERRAADWRAIEFVDCNLAGLPQD